MKIAVFGGSISSNPESEAGKNIWREQLNATVVTYGVGGMGFSLKTGPENIQAQVDKCVSKENFDVYVLWASNNDIYQGHPIGSYRDYTELDNFNSDKLVTQCGGINYCFKKIFSADPKAKVIFFTTLKSILNDDFSFNPFCKGGAYDYVKAQIECCNYWGVPCLNQFINVPINKYNKDIYLLEDLVHMTEEGYKLMGNIQAKFIENNI